MDCSTEFINATLGAHPPHMYISLMLTVLAAKCGLHPRNQYPEDYGPKIRDGDVFDFIVIGAGSAGSVVANRLSENPNWRVLLIEAGGYPTPLSEIPSLVRSSWGTEEDWRYTTEPSNQYCRGFRGGRCNWIRGKVLGGSSQLNAMLYIRGVDEDYREWVELGNPGWDPETVKKYFLKSENVLSEELQNSNHGHGGYLATSLSEPTKNLTKLVFAAVKETGYNVSFDATPIGFFNTLLTINKGVRADTASAFLGPIRKRKNLMVALNSEVTKINFVGNKLSSVSVKVNGIITKIYVKKEVIVSGGAINTPKLLMASGIGPEKYLKEMWIKVVKDLPVGQNLQDHFVTLGLTVQLEETDPSTLQQDLNDIYEYFTQHRGSYASIGLLSVSGFLNTKKLKNPNIQIQLMDFHRNSSDTELHFKKVNMNSVTTKFLTDLNKKYLLLFFQITLLKPKSRGEIKLKSKNPSDKPLIYPNYLSEQNDIEILLEGIDYIKAFINTKAMQKYSAKLVQLLGPGCQDIDFDTRDYWICFLRFYGNTIYHPVGTCAMSPKGVVDERLRVRGIKGLRIIDGSVLPIITSGNINAPIIMVAEKGSDMIKEDHDLKV